MKYYTPQLFLVAEKPRIKLLNTSWLPAIVAMDNRTIDEGIDWNITYYYGSGCTIHVYHSSIVDIEHHPLHYGNYPLVI